MLALYRDKQSSPPQQSHQSKALLTPRSRSKCIVVAPYLFSACSPLSVPLLQEFCRLILPLWRKTRRKTPHVLIQHGHARIQWHTHTHPERGTQDEMPRHLALPGRRFILGKRILHVLSIPASHLCAPLLFFSQVRLFTPACPPWLLSALLKADGGGLHATRTACLINQISLCNDDNSSTFSTAFK